MGESLRKLGKYSEAEAALKRALDIHVKALGEGNAATQRTLKALVTFYSGWKKPAEAAAYTARLKPVEATAPAAAAKSMVHSAIYRLLARLVGRADHA